MKDGARPMKYTAGQAAKAVGVSTATITRALKSGKISGEKDENGSWSIDLSELYRVFQPVSKITSEQEVMQRNATPLPYTERQPQITALEREIALLRENLEDLKGDRDKWREMAERLSLAPPREASKPDRAPFWQAIFKRR